MKLANLFLAIVMAGTLAAADDANPCFNCHKGSAESRRGGIQIDPARFATSTHFAVGCAGCHMEGFDAYPHKGKRTDAPDCTTCHSGDESLPYNRALIEKDVKASVHAQLVDPDFKCSNCHSPHDFRPVRKMASIEEAIQVANNTCMECHTQPDEKAGITAKQALQKLSDKHTWIPMWDLHTKAARCVDCHTQGNQETIHRILPAAQAQRECVACHSRDSVLMTKLYKHIAKEERTKGGIVNAVMFNNAYMIGATKNSWLDTGSLLIFGLALAGIALHGLGRYRAAKKGSK